MGQKDIAWSQGSVWEVLRKVGVIATRFVWNQHFSHHFLVFAVNFLCLTIIYDNYLRE